MKIQEINNVEELFNYLQVLHNQRNYQDAKSNYRMSNPVYRQVATKSPKSICRAFQSTSKINSKTWDGRDIRSN